MGMPPIMFQTIIINSFQAGKNDDPLAFMSACSGFLLDIESELTKEYPFYGFGILSGAFLSEEFGKVRD